MTLFSLGREDGTPPVGFGIVLAILLATLLFGVVGRRLGVSRLAAWLLLVALGGILAITLTPSPEALTTGVDGPVACDLSRLGPASLGEYRRFDDPTLNILMFVPLGAVIGAIGRRRTRAGLALAALLLSPAVETAQALVVPLGRACQGGDLFDNTAGLLAGLALGWVAGRAWRSVAGATGGA